MSDPLRDLAIRDAIFEHEMFAACDLNGLYALESVREVEATWPFRPAEIEAALAGMAAEELVARTYGETWSATPSGRLAREARWQERGRRHPVLSSPAADLEDLALAVIASGGEEQDALAGGGLKESTLGVYLFRFGEARCASVVGTLILRDLVRREHRDMFDLVPTLALTADGRRHYAQEVVGRLGLQPPATILAGVEPERLPFDDLGLEATLADNLRFRWQEAERCVGARAWLAASALYGSILEVILLGWLQREPARAMQANCTPRDRAGQAKPLERWTLAELIAVATELDYIDASHARHAQALRESRNLIHPHKQIRERSTPDGRLALISQNVVGAVLEALASATRKGGVA